MRTINGTLTLVGLMLLAPVASAHTFGAHGAGFAAGLVHPLIGLDHLLALIGAGLWAGWLGGRAQYQLKGGFLAGMLGGALLAWGGFNLPLVEPMIAVSVLLIGVLAASAALSVGRRRQCAPVRLRAVPRLCTRHRTAANRTAGAVCNGIPADIGARAVGCRAPVHWPAQRTSVRLRAHRRWCRRCCWRRLAGRRLKSSPTGRVQVGCDKRLHAAPHAGCSSK